jgi:hypothetical protein
MVFCLRFIIESGTCFSKRIVYETLLQDSESSFIYQSWQKGKAMFPKQFVVALSLPFLALYPITPATAQTTNVYAKDRSSYATASRSLSTIDFESSVSGKGVIRYPSDTGITVNRVNLRTSGGGKFGAGTVYVLSPSYAAQDPVYHTGTGAILIWETPNPSEDATLEITLPPGVTAVSADVWADSPGDSMIDVIATTANGETHCSAVTVEQRPESAFVSFVSTMEITSLRFQLPKGQTHLILDNITFGLTRKKGDAE